MKNYRIFNIGFAYMPTQNYKIIKANTLYNAVKKYLPKNYGIVFCSTNINSRKSVYIATSPKNKIQKEVWIYEIIEN